MAIKICVKRAVPAAMLCGILALMLTACVGADGASLPAAVPSVSPSTAATDAATAPTRTPMADPASDPTTIVVHSDRLEVVDAAGVPRGSVDYTEPIAKAVAILVAATGTQPVVAPSAHVAESDPGTSYSWEGITLTDPVTTVESAWQFDWYAQVDGPSSGGLSITTAAGVRVGQTKADVDARAPGVLTPVDVTGGTAYDATFEERSVATGASGEEMTYSVRVRVGTAPAVVTTFVAPAQNWGG
ncbi:MULTISPECIES: hypothetical protein [unclassified Cryobacterium]|uniref:hypothetical protein n=1 Tax=unclassified Cryobacterium TaxID=2649013 RepID=UPI002AB51E61|nr:MULTISPECIES: hypothetical protein [unclassified Cryobacterium]MDY7528568.1 hypothetical protein [Cryobacterium sp. 10C2]MEB0002858.1 hypothetical protein [Cryobacterium sp. RTC2.1]MEB0291120.1 hypothetical protein [Cryobacterium sp. 10C2]